MVNFFKRFHGEQRGITGLETAIILIAFVVVASVFAYTVLSAGIFWNSRQSKWFAGASRVFTATGQHALTVDARGAIAFLKVVAFTGTSFTLDADYVLS